MSTIAVIQTMFVVFYCDGLLCFLKEKCEFSIRDVAITFLLMTTMLHFGYKRGATFATNKHCDDDVMDRGCPVKEGCFKEAREINYIHRFNDSI